MAMIPTTTIGTSDPLDLCEGFALFPALGTVRAGVASNGISKGVASVTSQILMWQLSFSATAGLLVGICGPAYAILLDVDGELSGNELELDTSDVEVEAGIIFGISVTVSIGLMLSQYNLVNGWSGESQKEWDSKLNFNLKIEIDVIQDLISLISFLLKSDDKSKVEKSKSSPFSKIPSSLAFFAQNEGNFDDEGKIEVEPSIEKGFNLAELFFPEIVKAICDVGGDLDIGPTLGIGVPVSISPTGAVLNPGAASEATYGSPTYEEGKVTLTTADTPPATVNAITLQIEHEPGFTLTAGFEAHLSLVKIFSVGGSVEYNLLTLLGITIDFGPYANTLTNDVGASTVVTMTPVEVEFC